MRIQCLQHVPFEGPGEIARWADARGHEFRITKLFRGEPLPDAEQFEWLTALGGPMSVHDEHLHRWFTGEKALIARCLQERRFVFGVCLGSQLLAESLGARVYRNTFKEIGWLPVRLRAGEVAGSLLEGLPGKLMALHWHGETYDLPAGCRHLGESEGCAVQAFELPMALGLQFHFEATRDTMQELLSGSGQDIGSGPYEQPAEAILAAEEAYGPAARRALWHVLDRIAARLSGPADPKVSP
jgi:GMP synthase-like glutamine amidotransferase